jgi:cell division protease FtsH
MGGDSFRSDLSQLVRKLLEESQREGMPISAPLREHLGGDLEDVAVHAESLEAFDLPNLQLALDAALARPGVESRLIGVAGQGRRFGDVGLADLLSNEWHLGVGAPEYVNVPIGPKETLACLVWGVFLVTTPEGRLCVFVRQGQEHGPVPGLAVQAIAHDPELARRFLAELRALMDEHDVFRNKMITIEADRYGHRQVVFLERPTMDESELVLPEGVLDRIERHVVGPTRHREALLALRRHLGRGLLLWGPPGTGKTHTIRYLASRLNETTVIILSGPSLGLAGAFGNLARRLAPSVVVLEDVDLVAQERTYGPFGASNPVLFELMNEMSGLAADADVAFVLTTNRPDALEPALAARPGRVDLAVEIPLPAEPERRRLLELYGEGLHLAPADLDEVVRRTSGMTASFFRELLRKASLATVEAGRDRVGRDDVLAALDELQHERSTLTRVLLGSEAPRPGTPHAWLEAE